MTTPRKLPRGVARHGLTGMYYGRKLTALRDGTKRRITTPYFASPTEAADALVTLTRQAEVLDPKKRTVEAFMAEWFAAIEPDGSNPKKPRVRRNTYDARLRALAPILPESLAKGRLALHPAFEALRTKRLKDFNDADLRTFLDRLAASGVGSRSVQMTYEVLRAAYRYAAQRRYVDPSASPFIYVDKPHHESKRKDALTDAELKKLFTAIRATKVQRSRTLLLLLGTSGLRIGEALGLRWEFVDLKRAEVKVRQQLVGSDLAPLKTRESRREVPLIPEVVTALKALKSSSKSSFVFASRTSDRPLDASNFRSEVFAPMLERAGLAKSGLTPHGLRSVAASLLAPGVDPVLLTKWFQRGCEVLRPRRGSDARARTERDGGRAGACRGNEDPIGV